jgi:hypothetical protein
VDQPELLKFAIQALERLEIPYAIVGSFASGVWGESRFTQDIDILVELKPVDVPYYAPPFLTASFMSASPLLKKLLCDTANSTSFIRLPGTKSTS